VILSAFLLGLTPTVFFQEPEENSSLTPLQRAVLSEADPKAIRNLLDSGSDVNGGYGAKPLALAARHSSNPEVLSALINAGAKVNVGNQPILMAARYNPNPEVISVLITAGANVMASDPLLNLDLVMLAARYNTNPDVVSVVLKAAGFPTWRVHGKSILDFAKENKSVYKTKVYKELEDLAVASKDTISPRMWLERVDVTDDSPEVHTPFLDRWYSPQSPRPTDSTVGVSTEFVAPSPGDWTLQLHSQFFDAYLVAFDSEGNLLSEDDDGHLNHAAKVVLLLEKGDKIRILLCAVHGTRGPGELRIYQGEIPELQGIARREAEIIDYESSLRAREGSSPPAEAKIKEDLSTAPQTREDTTKKTNLDILERQRKELSELEKTLESNSPLLIQKIEELAFILSEFGSFAEARPLFERALAHYEKKIGPEDPEIATLLSGYGSLLARQGSYVEAGHLFERMLAINETTYGPDHLIVAYSLDNLASILRVQGFYAEARPLLERALAIREKELGETGTAGSLVSIANLLKDQDNYSEARSLFQRALTIEENSGKSESRLANILIPFGMLLHKEGSYSEAQPLLERALKIHEKARGLEHPDVSYALFALAHLHIEQGSYAEARPLYERTLEILEKIWGLGHPLVASLHSRFGSFLFKQGIYEEARRLHERGLRLSLAHLSRTLGAMAEAERFMFLDSLHGTEPLLLNLVAMQGNGPTEE